MCRFVLWTLCHVPVSRCFHVCSFLQLVPASGHAATLADLRDAHSALRKQKERLDSGHPPVRRKRCASIALRCVPFSSTSPFTWSPSPCAQLRIYSRSMPPLFTELYVRFLAMLKVIPRDEMVRAGKPFRGGVAPRTLPPPLADTFTP